MLKPLLQKLLCFNFFFLVSIRTHDNSAKLISHTCKLTLVKLDQTIYNTKQSFYYITR
ncbi:hypothetical protein AAHE18_11G177500 [Arachis hypogaea]